MNKHHVKETREEATDKVKEREKREEEKREEGRRDEGREREQSPNCILVLQDASSERASFPPLILVLLSVYCHPSNHEDGLFW